MVDGSIEYRDSEGHNGKTITTKVNHGSTIIWKLDKNPGITEITNITIKGEGSILKEKPIKVDFDHWEAVVADSGQGEVSYYPEVSLVSNNDRIGELLSCTENCKDEKPPIIKVI
jgi:hypothetical protein